LVGVGRWGRNYVRTLEQVPNARLVRVASGRPEVAALLPPGAVVDANWRRVVAASDVDAVIVATPPALHAEMASEALSLGRAVLVEKPLTLDASEARALAQLAERVQRLVMVEHTHLFHPAFERLCAEARARGGVRRIVAEAGGPGPVRSDTPVLWDWGAHDVAMCLELLGEEAAVRSCRVVRHAANAEGAVPETVELWLGFSSGVEANLRFSNAFEEKRRRFSVELASGGLTYDPLGGTPLCETDASGRTTALPVAEGRPLTRAVRCFLDRVAQGDVALDSLDLGVRVVEVLARAQAVASLA
jgi:predicted dehydrogenase